MHHVKGGILIYYLIALLLYACIILFFVLYIKNPSNYDFEDENDDFQEEDIQDLKAAHKKRKKRVKVLPLYQRFLYNVWFFSNVFLMFLPLLFLVLQNVIFWSILSNQIMLYNF